MFKFRTLCVFEPPFGGLRDNVLCWSWAHWKARSGLPINVNWTFFARCYGWVATSENISKIGYFVPTRSLWSKISGRSGRRPPIIFAQLGQWMPYNFAADSFRTKKLCSRLSSSEVRFFTEIGRLAFLRPPLGDLGATYDDHLRLIGKRVVDFLLALIELFR